MRIRNALSFGLCLGSVCTIPLHAGFEVLRGDLFSRLELKAESNSNIYSNNLEKGDFVLVGTPEIGFKRDVALVSFEAAAGISVSRFIDDTGQNDENPYGSASLSWAPEGGKTSARLLASARQNAQANQDVNRRTVSNDYLLDSEFGHFATEKFGYRLRANFSNQDYTTPGLSDLEVFLTGFDARYQYSPKLESYAGYNYRDSSTHNRAPGSASINSVDHQFLLGLDGELLPKVKGRVSGGTVTRNFDATNRSRTGLLLNSSVDWDYKENVGVTLYARRDFDISPADQSILRLSLGFDVRVKMDEKIDLSGGASYSHENYSGGGAPRVDSAYNLNARCGYIFTQTIKGNVFLSYRTTDSTSVSATYDQVIVGVSAGAKF